MPLLMNRFWLKQEENNGNGGDGGTGGNPDPNKNAGGGTGGGDSNPFANLDDAWKEIKRLRSENGSHRNKNKEIESQFALLNEKFGKITKHLGMDEQEDPEKVISTLKQNSEALEMELELQKLARLHSISADQDEFFRFLLHKKFTSLKENQEITDEEINEIVAKAKNQSAGQEDKTNKNNSTGIGTGAKKTPAAGGDSEPTVEQFKKMGVVEKGNLYTKNPELYKQLNAQSRK